jgi:uncharacterized protein YqeY
MSLRDQLDADLKDAMRARDQTRMDAIRQIKAVVMTDEVKAGATFDDAKVHDVIGRLVRQHRESIEMFAKGNRADLKAKEETELRILLSYLPQQMTAAEIMTLAKAIAQEVGARGPADKGKIMGKLMPQVKGKAEGAEVNRVVTELLAGLPNP